MVADDRHPAAQFTSAIKHYVWEMNVFIQRFKRFLKFLLSFFYVFNVFYFFLNVFTSMVHTADMDKTRLSRLVLFLSAMRTELATSQDCRRQNISKLNMFSFLQFCPVSNLQLSQVAVCCHL